MNFTESMIELLSTARVDLLETETRRKHLLELIEVLENIRDGRPAKTKKKRGRSKP